MTEEHSTRKLVDRARQGEREAFDQLMARFRDRLLTSIRNRCQRTDRPVDPEDVLSETVLRAFESLDRFEWTDEDSFLKWLFGIARNLYRDWSRRKRPLLSLSALEGRRSQDPTPSTLLRRVERFDRLQEAIAALPDHYRDVVYLSRIEGLKTQEVADRLGKSVDSVKHMLARAVKLLREKIGDTQSYHLPDRNLEPPGGRVG